MEMGKIPPAGPPTYRLRFAAVAEPAADLVDDVGQRRRQGQLGETGPLHGSQDAENLGAGGAFEALLPEPGHRLLGDKGQGGNGDEAVEQEGGAGIFPRMTGAVPPESSGAGGRCPPA